MVDIERIPTAVVLTKDPEMVDVFANATFGDRYQVMKVALVNSPLSNRQLGECIGYNDNEGSERATLPIHRIVNRVLIFGALDLLTQEQHDILAGLQIGVEQVAYPDSALQY